MQTQCDLDENGNCKTHSAGSPATIESENEMVQAIIGELKKAGSIVATTGVMLGIAAGLLGRQNERLVAAGKEPLRSIEKEMEAIVRPVALAFLTALDQLEKLHTVSPNAS